MALVTSVRNENSYAGVNLFFRERIAHHLGEGNRHIDGGLGLSDPEDDLMLDRTGLSGEGINICRSLIRV